MLNPNQVKIFLTNIEDFIFTRVFFYSRKVYPGLEEFANNLGETLIGELLVPKETVNKFWEHNFKDEQKQILWKQLEPHIIGEFYREPLVERGSGPPLISRLRLGYHLPCRHDMKAHLFQCCKSPREFEDYLQNFTRLNDEFEEYFRRRKEQGKKPELLVWNSIECELNVARRAGNFDLEWQKWEPAIKAWEQRNNASFYGDWNWEDLLGKATLTWREVFAVNNYSVYTNSNLNNQSHNIPHFTKHESSLRDKPRQSNSPVVNSNSPSLPTSHSYQPTVHPISVEPSKKDKSNYFGGVGIFGVIFLFLLVVLVTVVLTKRKKKSKLLFLKVVKY